MTASVIYKPSIIAFWTTAYLEKLLRQGAEQARAVAEVKLAAAYRAVGLRA